jgi:hypothetical protein
MPQAKEKLDIFLARLKKPTEIDWARLAAFIDGEGTIFIQKRKRAHCLTLIVANTDNRLIKWLQDNFGGNVYFSHSKKQRFECNTICYSWRVFEERAEAILRRVHPYMICKAEQAEAALNYRALKAQGSRGQKVTPEQLQARDDMRNKVIALNSSSVHKTLVNAR